ncbi:MAG: hypothetical protein KDK29_20275 [Sedimentitalea sp.]|nr:hypothetical protein [Sedimentitalea sp.]
MSGARITLRIDRVVLDRPGLTHAALAEALRSEIAALVAREGVAALGPGRSLAQGAGRVAAGPAVGESGVGRAQRVARGALAALRGGGEGG